MKGALHFQPACILDYSDNRRRWWKRRCLFDALSFTFFLIFILLLISEGWCGPPHTQLGRTYSVRWTLCAIGQTGRPVCSSAQDICENMAIRCWSGGCCSILAEIWAVIALETAQAVKCYTSRLLRLFHSRNSCKGVGERVKTTGDHRLWEACYKAKWALVSHTQLCFMLKVYNFQGVSDQETELKYF